LPASRERAVHPWFVAAAVLITTLIGVMDSTLVGLRYIAADLSVPAADSEWVMASYMAAFAFVLPITGWLSVRFGRRNFLLGSIALFTTASLLCGMATSLPQLILFRVIQGLGAGGLVPFGQAVLFDSFPLEKQGAPQALFSFMVALGPILGPTLGGWLVENLSWPWVFYINVPAGIVAFFACYTLVADPDYLRQERAELRKRPTRLDGIGLGLLALVIASWEIMTGKGQDWEWISDPLWRVQTLLIVFVLALAGLLLRELTFATPVINFRERSFAVSCLITFGAFALMNASSEAFPSLLLTLFGNADVNGFVLWRAGVFAMLILLLVDRIEGGIDARWLIASGLLLMAAGNYFMTLMKLDIGPWLATCSRVVTLIGLLLVFVPLNVAAFLYIPRDLRGVAVGLLALFRFEGGSFGTSIVQTLLDWRTRFHTTRLDELLGHMNLEAGDPAVSQQMVLHSLAEARHQQAAIFAYFDVLSVAAVASLALVFLVILMKRSVIQKRFREVAGK
jgi:DHA2 family multidrug resistance protein